MILPDAEWRHRPGLDRLIEVLGAGAARFVGGAVRDTLLGIAVADVDIATVHAPQTAVDRLKAAGIKSVPTGIEHGTITAVLDGWPVEVTTLRRDVSTDGRRATVAFTDDWREDAARRDFTMNALYADPISGQIFDYFGGLDDLEARRVRFIGDPLQRIAEDHLRILRFFRFLARFGDTPDPAGLDACAARSNDLMALSRERIADELLKLLCSRQAPEVVALMIERGIFTAVLPEISSAGRLEALAAREAELGLDCSAIRHLAALIPSDEAIARAVGARLKLSNRDRERLANAAQPAGNADPRELAYRIGSAFAIDRLLLDPARGDDAASILGWTPPRLPISGGAIVSRGVSAGPEVARLLRRVEEQWIAEGFPDQPRVDAIADAVVNQT